MNIYHLRYALEIAKTGSIKNAAENLYMAQPNLSRAIKELENSIGITIFERTTKGVIPTADGKKFLQHAKKIVSQVEEVQNLFNKRRGLSIFSITVPRASYISNAFTEFSKNLNQEKLTEIFYCESNPLKAINNLVYEDYKLAILRYNERDEEYFKELLEEKGLKGEMIARFGMKLVFSANSELASLEKITLDNLSQFIECSYGDQFIPSLTEEEAREVNRMGESKRIIYLTGRASMFDLLSENNQTFARCSPITDSMLKRYNLVQVDLEGQNDIYKDFLVYKKDYKLSELDKNFITELCNSRRKYLK
ncbi:MAG: LysR family transcriptional regulator [Clostridia bacterium]|nr:LysR family transcriptional regulator [Clostridia bacterium]